MKYPKKALVGLTLLPLGALPLAAHADASAINPAIRSATAGFFINYDQEHLNYREDAAGGGTLDSDTGTLRGLSLGKAWVRDDQAYIQIRAAYRQGKVTYVGQTFGGTPVTGNQDTDRAVTVALRLGYMFAAADRMTLTPYIRIGDTGIGRQIGVTAATPDGQYKEAFGVLYAGLGLMDQYAFTDRLVGNANIGYDADVYSRLDIVYPNGGTCEVPLGRKPIKTASIGLNYRMTKSIHAVTSLSVRQYGFGQSQPFTCGSSTLYEPTDHITETVARVGLQF